MVQMDEVARLTARMAVPKKSLGLLETQLQKLMRAWKNIQFELKPFHYIFAADNGIIEEGVVRQPQDITYLQARNMMKGLSTISCFCIVNNIPFLVVDVGINRSESVGLNRKVRQGTRNFLKEPAMTEAEFNKAYEAGREQVSAAINIGYNILSFGEMGIGNTTTSSAVLHALSGTSAEFIVGYGANPAFPEVIQRKRQVITEAVRKYKDRLNTPQDIIRYVGGFDIAALCGAMVQCGESRVPFVLDGFITAVAFACAVKICPEVARVALPSHLSKEPGMKYALSLGGISEDEVPIRAGLALGEGTGAILELNILKTMLYTVAHIDQMEHLEAQAKGCCRSKSS
ncbi:Nicotinate-nucleotide--dimethylbenzimidazole phosphoribosyltransferase [Anaerovibrio sp. JC8]|uniref:nicotinate-nucleotide--dimethylbenzimidazole phosphoribosyltransferase n=1 Tax=Anaerovibrio sp. JC8 TaxID=1240085 RepID=UPI000A0C96B6|nr:nicotinate-nucleotide--dimethylbenzimidazole phosphoribosyltransferase [Anaerovibrio sp. JC8]ORU01200.1 Nicotinate-nucleotide--dimethylbenzimidazole phosphoribosyltransferase [Anaerovibrio sp. JC8]